MTEHSANREQPYLSVVVPSRNDNHGGDLLDRMQTFVNTLAELSDRFALPVELLIVEWNPPTDRPRLAEALRWPASDNCGYRIVQVPPELHARYRACGSQLPLFQMIAKNVGIRRSQADFVLATNIDLIFSEDLLRWLALRPLKEGIFYRADRYDVPLDVMRLPTLDEQLRYCCNNLLRINSRHGTINRMPITKSRPPWLRAMMDDHRWTWHGQRIREHWTNSKENLSRAVHERSLLRLARGAHDVAKAGVRMGRFIARGTRLVARSLSREPKKTEAEEHQLHTNACGDFTLLAKQDWLRLRGYAEFEIYSWHLDSLFLFVAHASGIKQEILSHPIYHIEHTGGWTPESSQQLFSRLDAKQIRYLTNKDLEQYRIEIQNGPRPYYFNDENWGLADRSLPDYAVASDWDLHRRRA